MSKRDSKTISYRLRGSNETFNLIQKEFLDLLNREIETKEGGK